METTSDGTPATPRPDTDDTEILAWATLPAASAGTAAPGLDAAGIASAFAALEPDGPPVSAVAASAGGELVTFRHGDIAVRAGVVAGPVPGFVETLVSAATAAPDDVADSIPGGGDGGRRSDFHLLLGAGCAPGVDGFDPVERVIALLKLAMALAGRGDGGAGGDSGEPAPVIHAFCNPANDTCLPAAALSSLARIAASGTSVPPPSDQPDGSPEILEGIDAPPSLWDGLRESGAPPQLLMNVVRVRGPRRADIADDTVWAVTRGLALCGLPELASRVPYAPDNATAEDDGGDPGDGPHARALAETRSAFHLAFGYMMHAGPVIRPGHTLGTHDGLKLAFSDAPPWLEEAMDSEFGLMEVRATR